MKKILSTAAIFACVLVLAGCGSKKTIVGDWAYGEGGVFTYHFDKDGTCTYMGTMKCKYTEKDGKVEIQFDGADNKNKGTWEDDTLTMKDITDSDVVYKRTK